MGKRGKKGENNGVGASLSIREEASGKRQSHNPKSMLKLKHLQNLAVWATDNAQAASLGAFFGHSFAEFGESLGVPPDPSLFSCQRCETIICSGISPTSVLLLSRSSSSLMTRPTCLGISPVKLLLESLMIFRKLRFPMKGDIVPANPFEFRSSTVTRLCVRPQVIPSQLQCGIESFHELKTPFG